MLIFFHKNKGEYSKGQLTPFFIVILVIIIIMAMVTVNISKVAFVKTESANGADAGALAAGSVMANLFNVITKVTQGMEEKYWEFFKSVSFEFIAAITYLTDAYTSAFYAKEDAQTALDMACVNPCAAIFPLMNAIDEIFAADTGVQGLIFMVGDVIIPEVQGFHDRQFSLFQKIFQMVTGVSDEGLKKAIKMGKKFAFMNSGITDKLKDRSNYEAFLASLTGDSPTDTFEWVDGQGRDHVVIVQVSIDPIDAIELKIAKQPYSEEMRELYVILDNATFLDKDLNTTYIDYQIGLTLLFISCAALMNGDFLDADLFCSWAQIFINMGLITNSLALDIMSMLYDEIPLAWLNLLPMEENFTARNEMDAQDKIICWIEDVMSGGQTHNRRVRVDTTQIHAGAQGSAFWNAQYPQTNSYSVVSFRGKGQIHKPLQQGQIEGPIIRHNPSIIETDNGQ